MRLLLAQLKVELEQLTRRIEEADAVLKQTAQENEACRRLVAIPGVGAVTATALIACRSSKPTLVAGIVLRDSTDLVVIPVRSLAKR